MASLTHCYFLILIEVMSSVVLSPPSGASSWQKVDGKWKTVACQVKPVQAVPGRPERDLDFEVNTRNIIISNIIS